MCSPLELPCRGVKTCKPAANPKLAATVADKNSTLDDQGRHSDRLAEIDVTEFGLPDLLSGVGVDTDRLDVERVVVDLAVGVCCAAIDVIAAGDAFRRCLRLGRIAPLEGTAGLGQIESVQNIRPWGHDVHRVVHDERSGFMSARQPG